jgi:hypothetical protein
VAGPNSFRQSEFYRDYFYGAASPLLRAANAKWLPKLASNKKGAEKSIAKLIQFTGEMKYPDAFQKTTGQGFFRKYFDGKSLGRTLEPKPLAALKEAVRRGEITDEDIKLLQKELARGIVPPHTGDSGWNYLQEDLKKKLEDNLDPATLKLVKDKMAGKNFYGGMIARELRVTLATPHFENQYSQWEEEYEAALVANDRATARSEQSQKVKEWYTIISYDADKLPLPKPSKKQKEAGATRFRNEHARAEAFAWVEACRDWLDKHRLSKKELEIGEDPDSKIRTQVLGPYYDKEGNGENLPNEAIQGLYTYIGFTLMENIGLLPPENNDLAAVDKEERAEAYASNSIVFEVAKKFAAPRMRGGRGVVKPTEGQITTDAEKKQFAKEQAEAFVGAMQKQVFDTVFTKVTPYEKKLAEKERRKGEKALQEGRETEAQAHFDNVERLLDRRPAVALDTHNFGGFVQQMMGHSLSPEMHKLLKHPTRFRRWGRRSATVAFGHNIRLKVSKNLTDLWNNNGERANPCFDNIDHFMEEVGAFADPKWAFAPFTPAFFKLEKAKREHEYILDDPDTAYDHLMRVAYWVDFDHGTNCETVKRNFRERFTEIADDFVKKMAGENEEIAEAIRNSDLLTPYKRDETVSRINNRTNNPFKGMTPQHMNDLIQSAGLTLERIEIYFNELKRQQKLDILQGYDGWYNIPDLSTFEGMMENNQRVQLELDELQKYVVRGPGGARQLAMQLMEEATQQGVDPALVGAAMVQVNQFISDQVRKGKSLDKERFAQIFRSTESWKAVADSVIKGLPPEFNSVKTFLLEQLGNAVEQSANYDVVAERQANQLTQQTAWIDDQIRAAIQSKREAEGLPPLSPEELEKEFEDVTSPEEEDADEVVRQIQEVEREKAREMGFKGPVAVTPEGKVKTVVRRRTGPEEEAAEEVMRRVEPEGVAPPVEPVAPTPAPQAPVETAEEARQRELEELMRQQREEDMGEDEGEQFAYDVGVFGESPNDQYSFSNQQINPKFKITEDDGFYHLES